MAGGDAEDRELQPGARVRIVGLATRPELNHQRGTLKAFDEGRRRWKVEMDDGGVKLFRLANVESLDAAPAEQATAPGFIGTGAGAPGRPASVISVDRGHLSRGPTDEEGGRPEEASTRLRFRPGAQVLVRGLPGSDRGSLNGQIGHCEHFEFNSGRWHVRFEDNSTEALRPEFLELQQPVVRAGAYVCLEGLQGAAHLNGKVGVCEKMDAESGRWKVRLCTGELKALRVENLVLVDGDQLLASGADGTLAPAQREQPSRKVAASKDFATQMEEMLESGEMQWMDC